MSGTCVRLRWQPRCPFSENQCFLLPRDLKVSNLLMTDKGCVKTGGCWVLTWHVWRWVSLSLSRWGCSVALKTGDGLSVFLARAILAQFCFQIATCRSSLSELSPLSLCCSGLRPGSGLWCASKANDSQGCYPLVSSLEPWWPIGMGMSSQGPLHWADATGGLESLEALWGCPHC